MHEIKSDAFYDLARAYDPGGEGHFVGAVDYHILTDDGPYEGLSSHREALRTVFDGLVRESEEYIEEVRERLGDKAADKLDPWVYDLDKARAEMLDPGDFLSCPGIVKVDHYGNASYDAEWKPGDDNIGTAVPYWYAVMEPVMGKRNRPEDFKRVNEALFPGGPDALDVFEWTTDWSDYFDDGLEWYGACCWSVYDRSMNRYVVMVVSETD